MPTLTMSADESKLSTIRDFVACVGQEAGLSDQVIADLQLAVDEVCANVLRHGYRGQGGELAVTIQPLRDAVRVTVQDWGVAFDPQAVPEPDVATPLEQRPLGGMGLYLVRQVMDEVLFEFGAEKGNTVTMVRRL
jgi:serine/threonine-protein kinase RsbW